MWVKASASWWGALLLSKHLEMCLQNGSVLYICSKVSLQSSMRSRGAFTLLISCCDDNGIASVGAFVLLLVGAIHPSAGDAGTELMRILAAAGLLGTSNNQDRQSAVLFHAPNNHSKVMLYVANLSDHWFTLLFMFLQLRNFCKSLWLLNTVMSDNSCILLWCNIHHRLLVWECSIFIECPSMYLRGMWLVVPGHCSPVI